MDCGTHRITVGFIGFQYRLSLNEDLTAENLQRKKQAIWN